MIKPLLFFAAIFTCTAAKAYAPLGATANGAAPELVACLMVTLSALVLAYIGLRRSITSDERVRSLQMQLTAEREARDGSDAALAANREVLCRLLRQQEGIREGERQRIGTRLQAELGSRLHSLRGKLEQLQKRAATDATLRERLDSALTDVDGLKTAMRGIAASLHGVARGEALRQALERCLDQHADLHGLAYRFEAGVDPASASSQDRIARLAVFQVLQEVLANAAPGRATHDGGDLHVRLQEGAGKLLLDIQALGTAAPEQAPLSERLSEQLRLLGGELRVATAHGGWRHWSLSLPVHEPAAIC